MKAPPDSYRRLWLCASITIATAVAETMAAAPRYVLATVGLPTSNAGYTCSPFNQGGWTGVAFADVDADGDDNLGVVGRLNIGLRIFVSDGNGNWSESSNGLDLDCHGRSDVDFADLDGDGDLDFGGIFDINVAPAAYRNDGGTWVAVSNGLTGGTGEGFSFGDFDGDGFIDLTTVGHFSGGTRAWFGDGTGDWVERSSGLEPSLGGHRAATGDFDGDGRDEIIGTQFLTFDPLQDGVRVWKYDPVAQTWSAMASWYFDQPYGVAAADANGDGWNDVIVAAAQDSIGLLGSVHVFLNQGQGTGFVEASAGLPVRDAYYGDLAVGDLDNDGDLDIVTGDWGGVMRLFTGDGGTSWTEETGTGLTTLSDKTEGMAVGDMDGDCRLDVAAAAYARGIRAFRADHTVPCPILAEAGPARVVCGGDVILDGSASRACCPGGVIYRWWEGSNLIRDWAPDPRITVAPTVTSLYRLDVACAGADTCFVSDGVTLALAAGAAPPALGNVLLLVKSGTSDIMFAWVDLTAPTAGYEVLVLPDALGPPTQATFDGPLPTVVVTALPGLERAIGVGSLVTVDRLDYFRVRATSTCGGITGPA